MRTNRSKSPVSLFRLRPFGGQRHIDPVLLLLALWAVGGDGLAQGTPHVLHPAPPSREAHGKVLKYLPTITTPSALPRSTECVDYSATLTASGGGAPYTYAVTGGTLPAGLSLTTSGVIAGVPSSAGAALFTVTVTEIHGCSNSASFVLPVSVGYRAPDNQVGLAIPPVGSGGSGIPAQDTTVSTIVVSGVSSSVAVPNLDVHVTLLHDRDDDQVLTLVTPGSTRITLASHQGSSGSNYLGTIFSDGAPSGICTGSATFSASFRPEQTIGIRQANGTWKLEIADGGSGNVGQLLDWSIDFNTVGLRAPKLIGDGIWDYTLPAAPDDSQGMVMDDTHVFVSSGSMINRILKSDSASASNWIHSFAPNTTLQPLIVQLTSGNGSLLVVNASDGLVYALNISNGVFLWSKSTRRAGCSSDSLTCAPVAQLRDRSNCLFQAAFPNDDLVFAGTTCACGSTTANRVYALQANSGTFRWSFNGTFANLVDHVTGLAVDYQRNHVYAVTAKPAGMTVQSTVFGINSINGSKIWSMDLGAFESRPIVGDDGVYVVTKVGIVYKLDPDTGTQIWNVTLAIGGSVVFDPMAFDPTRKVLFVRAFNNSLWAISDNGASGSIAWTTNVGGAGPKNIAVAPFLGKLYVSASDGRVYQLDELTGVIEAHSIVVPSGPVSHILLDSTVGGGLAEARVMAIGGTTLDRTGIPWVGPGNHGGGGMESSPDPVLGPNADVGLQGNTTPLNPAVGQNVIDTLTVSSNGNRAPYCVVVQATVPAGMSFISATVTQGSLTIQGNQIIARLGQLPIDQTASLHITLRLDVAGSFPRTYGVSSEITDPMGANNMVTLTN